MVKVVVTVSVMMAKILVIVSVMVIVMVMKVKVMVIVSVVMVKMMETVSVMMVITVVLKMISMHYDEHCFDADEYSDDGESQNKKLIITNVAKCDIRCGMLHLAYCRYNEGEQTEMAMIEVGLLTGYKADIESLNKV